ncbi:uncharacterized protein LOC131236288 [Magnolia sinica]|uniref:uncharacterized protein LOC131236288 n=1 Tax=Magnolia sinica TaxID=86752 RepID=UPI002659CD01|nr:uncharacterized protein LOC131236288 [Magnolia sinica]
MYHLIPSRRKLLQITTTPKDSSTHFLFLLFKQNPSSLKPFSNISANNPTETQTPPSSFTLSYLINSCGLSLQSALSASLKIQLQSPENPDSDLSFFRNHGFTKTQIAHLIAKLPRILLANPDKTLKPKIQFFHGLNIPGPILTKIISSDPIILTRSLKNQIIPSVDFIKTYVHTNECVLYCMRRSTRILRCNLQKVMEPKIGILRKHGMPESKISRLIMIEPRVLLRDAEQLNEIITMVKKLGFDPLTGNFILAINVVSMNRLKWEQKVTVYQSLGWSVDEFLSAIRRQPYCMKTSEKKIKRVMSFFTNKMGWKPSDLSRYPGILMLSMEKRIVPRCSVLQILISKALVKDSCINMALIVSDKIFVERFLTKYLDDVPEILTVYRGKMGFLPLGVKSEDAGGGL